MGITGVFGIVAGIIISAAVESAARGTTGINQWVGIRVGYVTQSPQAWKAGHRAARWPTHCGTALFAGAGILVLAVPMSDEAAGGIGIGASLVLLGMLGFGAVRANRAAAATVVQAAAAQGS